MKGYRGYVSLILLVTLFFIVYPLQTTYAYFTDQTAINGNLKLTTGTLSLADIATNSQTFHTETEHTLVTSIQNTGSLDGKLTIAGITAKQNNRSIEYKDYLGVVTNFSSSSINSNVKQTLSVQLTKHTDWIKDQPIELAISVRISQANLAQDDHGFSDEKIYNITIINDQPKDENVDWPDFEGENYIEQKLYHSVVNGQLTTVVPGIVYLSSDKPDSEVLRKSFINAFGTGNYIYHVSDIQYIEGKGYRLELSHTKETKWKLEDPRSLELNLKWSQNFNNWNGGAFSHPFILDSEGNTDGKSEITEKFYMNHSLAELEVKFYAFNNQDKTKKMSEAAQTYIRNYLIILSTEVKRLDAKFNLHFSGVILKKNEQNQTENNLGKIQIRNGENLVFERQIHLKKKMTATENSKSSLEKEQKISSDESSYSETDSSISETAEYSTESIDETFDEQLGTLESAISSEPESTSQSIEMTFSDDLESSSHSSQESESDTSSQSESFHSQSNTSEEE